MFGTQTLGLCVYLPPLPPPLPPDSAARYYTNVCVDINVHGTICEYQNQWQNYSTSGVFNMPPQWLESEGGECLHRVGQYQHWRQEQGQWQGLECSFGNWLFGWLSGQWLVASGLAGMLSVSSIVAGTNGFSVVG